MGDLKGAYKEFEKAAELVEAAFFQSSQGPLYWHCFLTQPAAS